MKRLLPILFVLLLTTKAYSVPSNSISITPAAVDGAVITAADENSRNNVVSAAYNAHDHTDISQTGNTLNVGDTTAGNKTITAYNADTNKPYLRYDDTNNWWVFSENGVMPSCAIHGNAVIFEGTTDDAFETTLKITDPTADRTITIPNDTGTVVLSGASSAQTIDFAGDTIPNLGTVTTADINGGTIDGVTIGGASAGAGTFTAVTTGALTATANLDIGTYELRANTFQSDVATGTAPFTIASTTASTNLNADLLDGQHGSYYQSFSAFLARPANDQTDIVVGSAVTVVWGTEVFDIGNDFASNTFTAPSTGYYQLSVNVELTQLDTATVYYIYIITSNRTYTADFDPSKFSADVPRWNVQLSVLADMDATDTAYVVFYQNSGTQQTDIVYTNPITGDTTSSWFSGFKLG